MAQEASESSSTRTTMTARPSTVPWTLLISLNSKQIIRSAPNQLVRRGPAGMQLGGWLVGSKRDEKCE